MKTVNDKTVMNDHRTNVYSNFLMHWKYISRKRVNGKWQYEYEDPDAYDRNATVTKNVTTTYKNSDKLFDSTRKIKGISSLDGDIKQKETVIKERGKISQTIDKGKDWIDEQLYGYKTTDAYDRNAKVSKNVTTTYKNSNKLFDSTTTKNYSVGPGTPTEVVVKERGKIAQAVNKGQAYVNAFLRDRRKKKKSK